MLSFCGTRNLLNTIQRGIYYSNYKCFTTCVYVTAPFCEVEFIHQFLCFNSVFLILRSNDEMDITMGNIRVVILLHKKNGEVFLWPAVRQQPKDVGLMGILGKSTSLVKHLIMY